MNRYRAGDTLIEVLFAFVILATITGFAFTGALQSYKVSVNAQERTQATLLAQYQADGLKTYRGSISWSAAQSGTGFPSFLDGPTTLGLTPMSNFINNGNQFCMELVGSGVQSWNVQTTTTTCDGFIKSNLAPNLQSPKVSILLSTPTGVPTTNPNQVIATITVSWQSRNTAAPESVVNTIILTAEQ